MVAVRPFDRLDPDDKDLIRAQVLDYRNYVQRVKQQLNGKMSQMVSEDY